MRPAGLDYLQPVPLTEAHVMPGTQLLVRSTGSARTLRYPDHVVLDIGVRRALQGFSGSAVWIGTDTLAAHESIASLDLEGRVGVMIGPTSPSVVAGLAARGAVGLIEIAVSERVFHLYRQSRGDRRLYHRERSVASSLLPTIPVAIVDNEAAGAILAGTGPWRGLPAVPGPLRTSVELIVRVEERAVTSWNVACVLPGTEPTRSDTAVAFTAHLDHLGIGPPNTRGDSIYNGFSDNAAGVAMLLAIAEEALIRPPRYSWLFLFFGAEEQGLLGSDYYVHRPPWGLDRIVAVINLDAGAPPASPVTWRLAGVDSTTGLGAHAVAVAKAHGWSVTTSRPRKGCIRNASASARLS